MNKTIKMTREQIDSLYDEAVYCAGYNNGIAELNNALDDAIEALIEDEGTRWLVDARIGELAENLQHSAFNYAYKTILAQGTFKTTKKTAFYQWRTDAYREQSIERPYNLLYMYIKHTYSIGISMTAVPRAQKAWHTLRTYLDAVSIFGFNLGYSTARMQRKLMTIIE